MKINTNCLSGLPHYLFNISPLKEKILKMSDCINTNYITNKINS